MNRKKIIKIFLTSLIVIFLTSSVFTNAVNIKHKSSETVQTMSVLFDDTYLPEWSIGNKWIYNFYFNFDYSPITINGAIKNMELVVSNIDNQKNEYTVDITGNLDASLKIAGVIPGGKFTGDVTGYAHYEICTLAIKDFYFETDGKYSGIKADSTIEGNFVPSFDIFDFPIKSSEGESNPWDAETSAEINGEITILNTITKAFDINGEFEGEEIYLEKEEQHNVPAGTFDSLLIRGNMGPRHDGYSRIWYSDDVGYLVDIEEKVVDWYGVTATLEMPLQYTNFNPENSPPEEPNIPSGKTNVLSGESYTYTSKTTDDEEDPIYYKFDWGDGSFSEWLGPYQSDSAVSASHRWYKTGVYNVKVKARDESGIESFWSYPLPVSVLSEEPSVTLLVHKFSNLDMDDIDFDVPLGEDETPPEWYYEAEAYSNENLVLEKTDSNRNSNDKWIQSYTWVPDDETDFEVDDYLIELRIKLMDHDEGIEGEDDDLADISGCDFPDNYGANDNTNYKRGAIYHGVYNLATDDLEPYSSDYVDNSDFHLKENGYFKTCGDFMPDGSTGVEDFLSPENDACAWFDLWDNYDKPVVSLSVNDDVKLREGMPVRFDASVIGGYPSYVWSWDFDDGTTSNEQNPEHVFDSKGDYNVELTLTDELGYVDSKSIYVNIKENIKPDKPDRPRGSTKCKAGSTATYYSSTTDSEEDPLYYRWDFGDGTYSNWLGPYESGEEISVSHKWITEGSYGVKLKAVDDPNGDGDFTDGKVSSWSDPLSISVPKVKSKQKNINDIFSNRIFERYPFLSFFFNHFF